MGDRFQGEATRSVRQWGMNSYKFPDMKFDRYGHARFQEEPGRLDMIAWKNSRLCHIEVKDSYSSFAFANFETNKREYVEKYCTSRFARAWIWLCLGAGNPNWKEEKSPRKTWLVPIEAWYAVEKQVKVYQLSLPYQVGKGYGIEMQKNNYDAIHLLANYELQWVKGGWDIPKSHCFAELYLSSSPLPSYEEAHNVRKSVVSDQGKPDGDRSKYQCIQQRIGAHIALDVSGGTGALPSRFNTDVGRNRSQSLGRLHAKSLDHFQERAMVYPY